MRCSKEKKGGGSKVNGFFRAIATATIGLAKNKKSNLLQYCLLSSNVGMDTDPSNLLSIEIIKISECDI